MTQIFTAAFCTYLLNEKQLFYNKTLKYFRQGGDFMSERCRSLNVSFRVSEQERTMIEKNGTAWYT